MTTSKGSSSEMPPTSRSGPLTPPEVADRLRTAQLRCGYILGHCKDVREMRLEAEEMKRLLDESLSGLYAWWHGPHAAASETQRQESITQAAGESAVTAVRRGGSTGMESSLKASGVKQAIARMDGTGSAEAEAPDQHAAASAASPHEALANRLANLLPFTTPADEMPEPWEEDRNYRDKEIERLDANKRVMAMLPEILAALRAPNSSARPTVTAWGGDVALLGPEAPKSDGSIKHLIAYLLTVYERFGNTTVTFNLKWGASALWKRDEQAKRIEELEAAQSATRSLEPCHEALRTAKSVIKFDKAGTLVATKRDVVLLALELVRQSEGTGR